MSEKKDLNKIFEIKNNLQDQNSSEEKIEDAFDNEFYKDVDKARNRNNCSLPVVIIILVLIFCALVFLLIYIKNFTHSGIDFLSRSNNKSNLDISQSFIDKTKLLNPGESVILEYTDVEITQYLNIASPDFPLKSARLEVQTNGIIINGRTSNGILSLPVQVVVRPKIDQGKLTFIIDDVASGYISLPKILKDQMNSYLDGIIRSRSLYDSNLEIISASTVQGSLKIEVHKKP